MNLTREKHSTAYSYFLRRGTASLLKYTRVNVVIG